MQGKLEVIIDYGCVHVKEFFSIHPLPTSIKAMVTWKCDRKSALHPSYPAIERVLSGKPISMQATEMAVAIGEMYICSKIGTKSFKDGSQDICKDIKSNLRPVTGSLG